MNKKALVLVLALLVMLTPVLAAGSSVITLLFTKGDRESGGATGYSVESRALHEGDPKERLTSACQMLFFPQNSQSKSPIPKGVELRSCSVIGDFVMIDLLSPYITLPKIDRSIMSAALCMAAFESLEGIKRVKISEWDIERRQAVASTYERDTFLTDGVSVRLFEHRLSIYYVNLSGLYIMEDLRTLKLAQSEITAEMALGFMLETPDSRELSIPFGGAFDINYAEAQDEVCHVDLSRVILYDDPYLNYMSVFSIVNTLCRLSGIERVQITLNERALSDFDVNFCDGELEPRYTFTKDNPE